VKHNPQGSPDLISSTPPAPMGADFVWTKSNSDRQSHRETNLLLYFRVEYLFCPYTQASYPAGRQTAVVRFRCAGDEVEAIGMAEGQSTVFQFLNRSRGQPDRRRFLPSFFTGLPSSAAGGGLSVGKWMVPVADHNLKPALINAPRI
jgi:hypothetical protein